VAPERLLTLALTHEVFAQLTLMHVRHVDDVRKTKKGKS